MKRKFIIYFIKISIFFVAGCNGCGKAKPIKNVVRESVLGSTQENEGMPTNYINAWSDACNFSFELLNDNIYALGGNFIKYKRLNDSLFEVFYPKAALVLHDVSIEKYENNRYISFSNRMMGCCLEPNQNVIYFGPDRLKFQILSKRSIKVFCPKKSIWKISRISDSEIYIYNEWHKVKYSQFSD
jgi:hypothetical protein